MFAVPCEAASPYNADRSKSIALINKYMKLSEVVTFTSEDIVSITLLARRMKAQGWSNKVYNAWFVKQNIVI